MNLFDEIGKFCKGRLKHVDTNVTTPDGRQLIESRDEDGNLSIKVTGKGLGFVGDVKPDLQVAEILPWFTLGSQDVAHEISLMKKHNITHVLNVATGITNMFERTFTYKKIDILDLPDVNIRHIFEDCFEFINAARNSDGCVFVHCNAGVSRSVTVVIAYLMKHENMRYMEAFNYVKSIRPAIRPNEGFIKQLVSFDKEIFGMENDESLVLKTK